MMPEITPLLWKRAEAYPDILPRVVELSHQIQQLSKNSRSLRSYVVLQEYSKDIPLMHFVEETLKECDELPCLQQSDYKAYMMLLALSPDSYIVAFLYDHIVTGYIENFRIEELLFFTDLLREINPGRNLLNGVFNAVCYFFYDQQRNVFQRRDCRITDSQFRRAERNMPELGKRTFKMNVEIKGYRVYTVQELALLCNMEYGAFRKKFLKEFGITAGNWVKNERIEDVKYLLCSTRHPLEDVAIRAGFSSASSLSNYCVKHLHQPPGRIREISRNKVKQCDARFDEFVD